VTTESPSSDLSNAPETSTASQKIFSKTHGTHQPSTTPFSTCKEEIALIPEQINGESSSSIPRYFVKPQTPNNPTDINPGETGVSFPSSDKAYIIIFPIPSAATIESVRLPEPTNVDQIRVMFLDDEDKPINADSSDKSPLQITSKLDKSPTINVSLQRKVSAVHITLIHTSDNQPPRSVTIEIMACVEPSKTTLHTTLGTPKMRTTPASNDSSSRPCENIK
jgi:hypothetical protein